MASEPERPIEKLLRAAAQQRRQAAGEPAALHPATRRLLQDEVRRRYAQTPAPAWRWGGSRLWPTLAWSLGLLALVALVVSLWLPSPRPGAGQPQLLAKKELAPPPESQLEPASPAVAQNRPQAPAPAAAPAQPEPQKQLRDTAPPAGNSLAQADKDKAAGVPLTRWEAVPSRPATAAPDLALSPALPPTATTVTVPSGPPALSPAPTEGAAGRRYGLAPASASVSAPAPSSAASTAVAWQAKVPGTATAMGGARPLSAKTPTPTPRPVATASLARVKPARESQPASQPPIPILVSFQVKQSGRELQIVDSDGSIYRGSLQTAEAPRLEADALELSKSATRGLEEKPAATRTREAAPSPSQARVPQAAAGVADRASSDEARNRAYFSGALFRVSGTNRTSNQKVVFTGTLVGNPEGVNFVRPTSGFYAYKRTSPALAPKQGASSPPSLGANSNLTTRLSGKVVVGESQPVEIEAQPAQP